jgi:aspartate aminotransferase
MPQISHLAEHMPTSAIRMLNPFAEKAKADGVKVYHLNIGAPDIKSPQCAIDAIRNYQFDHLSYSNSIGSPELRRALLDKYYKSVGVDISLEDIIVTVAGSEALDFFFQITTNFGGEVIVFEPYYCNYSAIASKFGVKLAGIHTDIKDGFRLPPVSEIEKHITPRTSAILISNPSNPTGTLFSKEEMLQIADICRKHDLFFGCDEVYREFCYTDDPHFSVMDIPDFDRYAIMLDSVSKRFNLCGARIGCVISRNKEVMSLALKLAQARLCPPVLGQVATLGALDAPASYFGEVRKEYIARRNFTVNALNKIPGVYSPMPNGAFYTVAELPVDNAADFCKWLLTDFRLNGETLMLTPAAPFYINEEKGVKQVRIAYVLEIPELEKAMEVLANALDIYNKHK